MVVAGVVAGVDGVVVVVEDGVNGGAGVVSFPNLVKLVVIIIIIIIIIIKFE